MMQRTLFAAVMLTALAADTATAQSSAPRARSRPVEVQRDADNADRAFLGVSTSSSGIRDTLGLLITGVTPGSPAEKASLEEGNRIAAINNVNLRLSAADAGEDDMHGLTARRLTREMRKLKAGDDAELRVYQNGQFRNVKVKTVAASDVEGIVRRRNEGGTIEDVRELLEGVRGTRSERAAAERKERDARGVLGISLNATGGKRDTLGVLIVQVSEKGPAEKAGIVEGDRVAAINGVDLRVAAPDAGDGMVSQAKSNRFTREMRNVKPGQAVELRLFSGGQSRTVRVTAAKRSEVYEEREGMRFFFGDGEGMFRTLNPMPAMPAMPPMPAMPAMPPMPRIYMSPGIVLRRSPMIIRRATPRGSGRFVEEDAEHAALAAGSDRLKQELEGQFVHANGEAGLDLDMDFDIDMDMDFDVDFDLNGGFDVEAGAFTLGIRSARQILTGARTMTAPKASGAHTPSDCGAKSKRTVTPAAPVPRETPRTMLIRV